MIILLENYVVMKILSFVAYFYKPQKHFYEITWKQKASSEEGAG